MLFQIGAVFIISSSAGADVFPLVVGQLLETRPETLLQLTAATVAACIAVFAVTAVTFCVTSGCLSRPGRWR